MGKTYVVLHNIGTKVSGLQYQKNDIYHVLRLIDIIICPMPHVSWLLST